jgi:hypothetical protein
MVQKLRNTRNKGGRPMSSLFRRMRLPLGGAVAAALILCTTTLAGSGVGGVFNLGQTNTVDAQSILTGNPGTEPLLKVVGTGTAASIRANAGTGIAVNGISTSGTGQYGQSTSGTGLYGTHTGSTGGSSGVFGVTASTNAASAGVTGQNSAGPGPGVEGKTASGAGAGVLGLNSTDGVGVLGQHPLTTGTAPAVEGTTSSTDDNAIGLEGLVSSASPGGASVGVRGVNNGTGPLGIGVYGSQAGSGWGVYGSSPTAAWASTAPARAATASLATARAAGASTAPARAT